MPIGFPQVHKRIFSLFPEPSASVLRGSLGRFFLAAFSLHPLFCQKLRSPKRYRESSPSHFGSPSVLIQAYQRFSC